jgi:acyl carrier protein
MSNGISLERIQKALATSVVDTYFTNDLNFDAALSSIKGSPELFLLKNFDADSLDLVELTMAVEDELNEFFDDFDLDRHVNQYIDRHGDISLSQLAIELSNTNLA